MKSRAGLLLPVALVGAWLWHITDQSFWWQAALLVGVLGAVIFLGKKRPKSLKEAGEAIGGLAALVLAFALLSGGRGCTSGALKAKGVTQAHTARSATERLCARRMSPKPAMPPRASFTST